MSLAVDVSLVGVRAALSRSRIAGIVRATLRAEKVRDALISVTLLDSRTIARMNREHLGHSGPTDVITFSLGDSGNGSPVVGDVYIAPEVVRDNARRHGTGVKEELLRVVVHGTLHAIGHEHPDDEERTTSPMWRRQERIVQRLLTATRA